MYRFFEPTIRPLLIAARPKVVVEVGSDAGHGTQLLADWCMTHGAQLHVIDPLPKYDMDEWRERWPAEVVRFHQDLSLNVLPGLGPSEVVCLDGDHNWYTVFHELEALGNTARTLGCPYPLTLLHDVGWPYGRRDLYYNPETIPAAHRQPHRKGALVPGQEQLADIGYNDRVDNAVHAGTPRNGVLTAVEDYAARHEGQLRLYVVPGLHSLGILVDVDANPRVHEAINEVTGATGLRRILEITEQDRTLRLHREAYAFRSLDRIRKQGQQQRKADADRIAELRSRGAELRQELNARIQRLTDERSALRKSLDEARRLLREECERRHIIAAELEEEREQRRRASE